MLNLSRLTVYYCIEGWTDASVEALSRKDFALFRPRPSNAPFVLFIKIVRARSLLDAAGEHSGVGVAPLPSLDRSQIRFPSAAALAAIANEDQVV